MKTKQDGIIAFHVSVKIDAEQFESWKPECIAAFFDGVAKVLAAQQLGKVESVNQQE